VVVPWLPAGALASGIASLVFLRYLWGYRSKPGARFFIATIACEALWSFSYGAALLVFDPTIREILEIPIWLGVNFIGVLFLAFALEYTGRGSLVRSRWMGALVALQTIHTGIVVTNPLHGVAWSEYSVEPLFGAATVTYTHGPWLFVNVTGVILMIAGASFLLFDTFFSYGPLYRTQAAAVAISPVLPGATFLLWLFQVGGFRQVNLTPLAFPIHLVLDAYAFFSREMFELTPATRRAGERAAIDDLGTAVLIVDEDERFVDLNAEARRALGVGGEAVLGRPITEHLDGVDPSGTDEVLSLTVEGQSRQYTVTTSAVEDAGGTRVGHTVVLQDVTAERRREQRLAVLNRVLRHNLRNDLGVVKGYIEVAAERTEEEGVSGPLATAAATTEEVMALGEKARDVERTVGSAERSLDPVDVPELLAGIKPDLNGDGTVRIDVPAGFQVRAEPTVLDRVFRSLIENGLEHGGTDPRVEVECTDVENGRATFEIRDDGPGIPDHEREVLEAGEETALRHGSGLGLWIAKWGVTSIGGTLRFETGDDGTTAVVTLSYEAGPDVPESGTTA
jgi:PAS domain S-box-containing protein